LIVTRNAAQQVAGRGCRESFKIGGYYQNKVDALIDVDGHDEFVVLCASVGHIEKDKKDVYQHLPDLR